MPNISYPTNQKTHIPPTALLDSKSISLNPFCFYVFFLFFPFDLFQTFPLSDTLVLLSAPSPLGINGVSECAVIRSTNLGRGHMIAGD